MHFLSHYYTELPNQEPLFVAGLLLPDLTPGFTKIYNSLIVKHTPYTSPALKQIQLGIVQHFGADKRFHNSPLFVKHVKDATQTFIEAGLNRQRLRLSVIAHIAIEMMIDRQIILENEGICDEYYKVLQNVDEMELTKYFDCYKLETQKQNFLRSFQFFKQKKFLHLFTELGNITEGLNRVYSNVTKTGFTADERLKFLTALHNIDSLLRYSWQPILKP